MPIINLKISKKFDLQDLNLVVNKITNLTVKHLKKKPEFTSITVLSVEKSNWFINSKSLQNFNQNSFYLDIKVTESTNTKEEKSEYIEAIFSYMQTILDNIHSESYIYIEEVKADAYGFGGFTQEYRFIQNIISKQ